ncbi:MAG: L-seryl-tRNA(Sec) selenium transferase [Verrucomicrobia bacterium]|nr:L-seryl-tRNA(Sec) selenium transferase [Verrucomicrobiota bacterium]
MNEKSQEALRRIPSVDRILRRLQSDGLDSGISSDVLTRIVRDVIKEYRRKVIEDNTMSMPDIADRILSAVKSEVRQLTRPFYRKVVNAAGIILHTGLGRAVLPAAAMKQLQEELSGYSLLQVDIEEGKRSRRDEYIEKLLTLLTGAEAATVVNNNAAATAIVLNTVAAGKEVVVSRGQLVEIGGSYRLPDVMAFSGAKLVEVGTTNKTHLRDYEKAITDQTSAILRVHPSNYKIQGFTSEVPLNELVDMSHANGLILYDDVGAGSLIDFSKYGFEKEPTLIESVASGADVITSSGDKLIGAAQSGIILGGTEIINRIRKNQFARILRVDKITLAALEATLKLFLDEEKAGREAPTFRMLLRTHEQISKRAAAMVTRLRKAGLPCEITSINGYSQTGSGSLPAQNLPTRLVCVRPLKISSITLANRLRHHTVPIFSRIQGEQVMFDPRTLLDGDEKIIQEAITEILSA